MNIAEIAVRRPVTTLMFNASLILLGLISWRHLPVQLFPDLVLPQLGIFAAYQPGGGSTAAPSEIEEQLTIPIENILASLPRIKKISSHTHQWGCSVWVEMEYGTDMRFLAIELQERLDVLKRDFPRGAVRFRIFPIDTSEFQKTFMTLVIKGTDDRGQIRALALDQIQQRLENISGVSRVGIGGYSPLRARVRVDEQRLKEHRLPFRTIIQRVQNWSSPDLYLGQFKTPREIFYVRIQGQYENLLDIEQVALQEDGSLKVSDVATVEQSRSDEEREWIYRYEGREAIGIWLEKDALANPIVTAKKVRAELEKIQELLPPGYEIKIRWDDAEFIEKVIKGVTKLALLGGGVAMIVLLLFLRNLRAAGIVMLSVPISIISTFNLMYFAGFSFNLFSLVGLAFGIGMLVDNSIVVLENIVRHYHLCGDRKVAALRGLHEVSRPILASTLTTVIVFVPILFISDEIRIIFKEMALSIVFPIVMSLVVAYTFVPMATSTLLGRDVGLRRYLFRYRPIRWVGTLGLRMLRWIPFYRIVGLVPRGYRGTIKRILRHPMQMMLIVVFLILYAWNTRHRITEGFLNRDVHDEYFSVYVSLPKGTKTESTSRVSQQVEEMLTEYDEIDRFGARIQNERSYIWIALKDKKERTRNRNELLEEILDRTEALPEAIVSQYPPAEEAPSEVIIPYGGGGTVEIRGAEQEQLTHLARLLIDRILTIPGVRSAESSEARGEPELRLVVDREKALLFQVAAQQIAYAVQSMRKGGQLAEVKLHEDEEEIDILFEMDADRSRIVEDMGELPVFTGSGQTVPLGDICRFEMGTTPGYIRRENQQRISKVNYTLQAGQDLKAANELVKQHIAAMRVPPGYTIRAEQERRQVDELQKNLVQIVTQGTILIYMVLASLFESFGAPFVVLLALPLAIIGAIYGLIIMKNPFDVFAVMGVIVLVGIVVNNAILLLHFVTLKRKQHGWRRGRAIIVSCLTRFRPIWMTTLTTVVGLMPLAMKTSEKSIWTPFAVVVIGGLFGSTVLTPFVIPAMYVFLENQWVRLKRRFFWVLSWRWILFFWSKGKRALHRQRYHDRLVERFAPLGLPRETLESMPLQVTARHLTMVYPERRRSAREVTGKLLSQFKSEILLPSANVGIVPTGGYWLRDLTETVEDSRSGPNGFKALDDLNFDIGPGMFGLLGPNGAGKTTLIRILSTTLPPSRGTVSLGGHDLGQFRLDLARIIGYLPQTFGFYDRFTPMQYLNQMAIMKGLKKRKERRAAIERVLTQVNLWQERKTAIGNFSGGMRQRLGIAQTLLALPRIIIVDEPTAGLDPKERVNFRNLLAEISKNRIVILSTHIVEDISSSCNRVGVLDKGRLVFLGSLDRLVALAEGKVWEIVCPPDRAESWMKRSAVISQTVVTAGKRIRFFSEISPGEGAVAVAPTLEDAYIYVRRLYAGGGQGETPVN